MSTASILPQATPRTEATETASQQLAAALNIPADSGTIKQVLVSPWTEGKVSYRVWCLKERKLHAVHRVLAEGATLTINDVLYTLTERRWRCRPSYRGTGFIIRAPDYLQYSHADDVL